MKSGVINIYKEKGFTSFDVVAKMRGILKERKIGHTGTLDPDAEGVLPVCISKATKLCDMLTDKDKEYEAVMLLGVTTDTQDVTGQVLSQSDVTADEEAVRDAILSFVGIYDQVPPMYSALKVNGQKLCDLARKGIEVERKARRVEIFSIEILEIALPKVRMRVHCSKGTYIRTLCQDIGEKLGCGGCMESLLRTRVERFGIESAITLSQLQQLADAGEAESVLLPVDQMFDHLPVRTVKAQFRKLTDNGNALWPNQLEKGESKDAGQIRVYDDRDIFVGIYEYRDDTKMYKPVKIFME